jgi:Lipase (class 3)
MESRCMKRRAIAMSLSLIVCVIGTAAAAPLPAIGRDAAAPDQNRAWRFIPVTASGGGAVSNSAVEPWKGGLFPVLFLTDSKGPIGAEIAQKTGFAYTIDTLPERMRDVLVYADADVLRRNPVLAQESFRLAKVNGWSVVLESARGDADAVRSTLTGALGRQLAGPKRLGAVSVTWRGGVAQTAATSARQVSQSLLGTVVLPEAVPAAGIAKYAHNTPALPPHYSAFFAAAAFIDSAHQEPTTPVTDHMHYANPQNYINYIFGADVWTLAHDDDSRTWDIWKSVATSRDPAGTYRPNTCILAFRGTQLYGTGEWDAIIDITSLLDTREIDNEINWSGYTNHRTAVGGGFMYRLRNQRDKIFYKLIENKCATTLVTGHSLGGAMAQIFGIYVHTAWTSTGDGGYLHNKLTPTNGFFRNPFKTDGSGLTVNLRTGIVLHTGDMRAWNPIKMANRGFTDYYRAASDSPDNLYGAPSRKVYCRRNDLALGYGMAGWRNVGTVDDADGCDSWAAAVDTGTTYAAKRKNHAIRNWFGLEAR